MKRMVQSNDLSSMMKWPIPKKKVGVVRLEMVKESTLFYEAKHITSAEIAVELVKPLLDKADREMMLVMSFSTKMDPLALEIAAVGGLNVCGVDIRDIFKHSILNNAAYVMCFHNHPSGSAAPSYQDEVMTKRMEEGGKLLGIPLIDHIIVGEDEFYSFREQGMIPFEDCGRAA